MKCLKALSVPTNVVYTKEDSSALSFEEILSKNINQNKSKQFWVPFFKDYVYNKMRIAKPGIASPGLIIKFGSTKIRCEKLKLSNWSVE